MNYTKTQEKQMRFFRTMEATEAMDALRTYEATCYTCKESKTFHAACSVLDFIARHIGHATWTTTFPKQNPLTIRKKQ